MMSAEASLPFRPGRYWTPASTTGTARCRATSGSSGGGRGRNLEASITCVAW